MDNIEILELHPDEWNSFRRLRLEIMQSDPAAYAHTYEESVNLPESKWREMLTKNYFLGATLNDQVVGMIGVKFDKDGTNDYAILLSVGVSPQYRQKGIAKQIMDELILKLKQKKISRIKLWVSETQKPAIAFYESYGFQQIGRKKDEVILNDEVFDELIMEKHL